jgi:hypothetical protein
MKAGLDLATKHCDSAMKFNKNNVDGAIKSGAVIHKAAGEMQNELRVYSQQVMEDAIAATKAIMGSNSIHAAFELQSDFRKAAFDNYMSELTKFSELMITATKDSLVPFKDCAKAWTAATH